MAQGQVSAVEHHDFDIGTSQQAAQGFLPFGSEGIPLLQGRVALHPHSHIYVAARPGLSLGLRTKQVGDKDALIRREKIRQPGDRFRPQRPLSPTRGCSSLLVPMRRCLRPLL